MDTTSPVAPTPGFIERLRSRALYSPKETGAILNTSHATTYRLIGAGKLDARKIGAKTVITSESIERFLAELPKATRSP